MTENNGQFKEGEHRSVATEFQKGQTPWNRGIKHTKISGDNHYSWKGGKPNCIDCRKPLGAYTTKRCADCHKKAPEVSARAKAMGLKDWGNRGESHPGWKGGITSIGKLERARFNKTTQPLIFARDDYTCQICFVRGGSLQVDHIKSWSKYPELRFDLDNCRTLCMACHYYVTFKRKLPIGVVWGHNLSQRIAS